MNVRRFALLGLFLLLAPAVTRAEVTRVDIQRREDVLGGKSFGTAGAYEKLAGRVYFAVDPNNPRNRVIVDLDKAPLNAQGKVEFSADLYIIKPKDPSRGNGVVFFDIVNRGNKALLGVFSRAPRAADPTADADFGDASLLRQGYTLVAVGWQFDVESGRGLIGLQAPIATEKGSPITGWVRMWFIPDTPVPSFPYAAASYNTRAYPPLDLADPQYRLTEREGIVAPARLIPRDEWQFARWENGKAVPDANSISLKTGLKAGMTYEVAYETRNPPVAGLGMAAIRDMASALKNDASAIAPGRYAYMYGASQTGRLIRQIIYEGFTIDEQGRKAFDGAFVQTGATGLGSFNERFAQPNELGSFTQTRFPFLYKTMTDPITGRRDGLGARIPPGLEPKIMLVDSASEYWDRGRVAALRHTSIDGREDIEDAANVRVYLLAGTRHGAGGFPPADNGGQFKENTNDYRWAQRGLLAALDAWVRQGTEPPPSRHPRLSDGTLVPHKDLTFPPMPGVQWPQWPMSVPGGYRADVPGPYSVLPFLLPKVDDDGNDLAGIRLPEQAVPLATLTGWQFRGERIGAPNVLLAMAGAYIPFPTTRAERERTRDPRLSIAERYGTRADYLKKVQDAANRLAQERYILYEDIPAIVQAAGQHWDFRMAPAAPTSQTAAASRAVVAAKASSVPRAPGGRPDLQGIWDFRTITPMQRPTDLASKEVLTDQEAAEFEVKNQRNQDNREAAPAGLVNGQQSNADVERAYNDFWWDFGKKTVSTRRTSLVIDPADGRIPALTPEAQTRAAARREARERPAFGPEDRGVAERCLLGFNAGPPMAPSAYNNNVQLVQTPDYLVIHNEMVHNARIVPLAGQLSGKLPQWNGDSRGRWDGDTLVVETTRFAGETAFQNSSQSLHLTERFTRVDADTLIYEFTVNDPSTWTKPWTAQIPMTRSDEMMFEYACHEANYGMTNLLKGARFIEKEAGGKETVR